MPSGRVSRSRNGCGVPKTLWLTPEALTVLTDVQEETGMSFSRIVSDLIEASDPNAPAINKQREEEMRILRANSVEKDKIIERLEADLAALKKNSERGRQNVRSLETLSGIHPKSRKRFAEKMGLQLDGVN